MGIPLFILPRNTKTQVLFGFVNIFYKFIVIYLYSLKIDIILNVNFNLFVYELILLTIYYYFILAFVRTFGSKIKDQSNILHNLVFLDDLTQLHNRRYLNTLLNSNSRACTLALVDIDYFKRVNDLYGHQVGDTVLKKVSKVFKSYQYSRLSIVRYGGDEFLFILDDGTIKEISTLMENIRKTVETLVFDESGLVEGITISCGITQCKSGLSWDKALDETDRALYKAKEEGRNRICYAI